MALRTPTGACQKRRRSRSYGWDQYTCCSPIAQAEIRALASAVWYLVETAGRRFVVQQPNVDLKNYGRLLIDGELKVKCDGENSPKTRYVLQTVVRKTRQSIRFLQYIQLYSPLLVEKEKNIKRENQFCNCFKQEVISHTLVLSCLNSQNWA